MYIAWPILILLIPAVYLVGWLVKKFGRWPGKQKPLVVAESTTLAGLPSYDKVKRRHRLLKGAEWLLIALMLSTAVLLVSRPQKRVTKIDEINARDIVLCLDTSGSMTDYVVPSLEVMRDIVERNPSDNYSIVTFINASYPALPLTRDKAAIASVLDELVAGIDDYGSIVYAGRRPNGFGTDIGEGLYGALRRFDNLETERSRHIILLSDMEHDSGTDPIEPAQLIAKYNINIEVVWPADPTYSELQLSNSESWTNLAGAHINRLDSVSDVDTVLSSVYESILNRDETERYVLADNPAPFWLLLTASTVIMGGLLYVREVRRW